MKKTFISTLRLLVQLAREPLAKNQRIAIERTYSLRETINDNLDKVRALAHGVSVRIRYLPPARLGIAWPHSALATATAFDIPYKDCVTEIPS